MNSKDKLFAALKALLKVYSFDEISVGKLTKESGISRATFYRHFKDKFDLMNRYYQNYFDELFKAASEHSFRAVFLDMVIFVGENKEFFNKAYRVQGQNSWQQFIMKHAYMYCADEYKKGKNIKEIKAEEKILINYSIGGSLYVVRKWIEHGPDLTPETLTELIFSVMPSNLLKYLD